MLLCYNFKFDNVHIVILHNKEFEFQKSHLALIQAKNFIIVKNFHS